MVVVEQSARPPSIFTGRLVEVDGGGMREFAAALDRRHRRAVRCQPCTALPNHPGRVAHTMVGAPVAVVAVEQCASAPLARARPKGGDGDALPPLPPFGFGLTK